MNVKSESVSNWIRTIATIVAFVVTGSGILWSASAQVAKIEGRVTALEDKQDALVSLFTAWKGEHFNTDMRGWSQNAADHREIMLEVRANAIMLQDVAKKQAVVLDRLKIASP